MEDPEFASVDCLELLSGGISDHNLMQDPWVQAALLAPIRAARIGNFASQATGTDHARSWLASHHHYSVEGSGFLRFGVQTCIADLSHERGSGGMAIQGHVCGGSPVGLHAVRESTLADQVQGCSLCKVGVSTILSQRQHMKGARAPASPDWLVSGYFEGFLL